MAACDARVKWSMELSSRELVTICKALRCPSEECSEEERTEMKRLSNELAVRRATAIREIGKQNERLIKNLKEAGVWPEEEANNVSE